MLYSLLYVLSTAIATVLIQKMDENIPPLLSLLAVSLITSLYFNAINFKKIKKTYENCWKKKNLWFMMMLTVLLMWSCAVLSPALVGASLYAFLYFSWRGALGLLSLSFQSNNKKNLEIFCAGAILTLIITSVILEAHVSFSKNILFGSILSLLGGTCAFFYFKQSKQAITKMHFSATQILAVRFHLTILILFPLLFYKNLHHYLTIANMINFTMLAFLSMIIPLYFGQKALEKISSEHHSIISSLCPLVTGILQQVFFNKILSKQITIYIIYSGIILIFYLLNGFLKKKESIA